MITAFHRFLLTFIWPLMQDEHSIVFLLLKNHRPYLIVFYLSIERVQIQIKLCFEVPGIPPLKQVEVEE